MHRERTALEMTQERLEELTDLHLLTIQKIETGDINALITTAQRWQKALGLPLGTADGVALTLRLPIEATRGRRD